MALGWILMIIIGLLEDGGRIWSLEGGFGVKDRRLIILRMKDER